MEIYEFSMLDINAKADLLWEKGWHVDQYSDAVTAVNLYFLFNFFVEVSYSASENKIVDITPFKKGFRFDKYLDRIKIDKL